MASKDINQTRRDDLQRARKKAKPGDKATLLELSNIWGTTKSRFLTQRNEMTGFPDMVEKVGNEHFFPTREALDAMWAYETRNDKARRDRQSRIDRMTTGKKPNVEKDDALPIQDLIRVNSLQNDVEERERAQRQYIPVADVTRVTGIIFAQMSTFASDIASIVDPNGELTADHRARLDARGKEALLLLHAQIKGLLNGEDDGTARNRKKAGRPVRRGASSKRR